jgi:hypothetical protein
MIRTADEARADAVRAMGKDLGDLYSALWQEVAWVYAKWEEYVVLFGTKESRVILLNRAAPRFARLVQDTLWEDVLLHIARLTDSPTTLGKDNLTIRRLANLVADHNAQKQVADTVSASLMTTAFCRDWRNRHLAHRDLQLALKRGALPLAEASRQSVREALHSLVEILNAVSAHYLNSTSRFDGGPDAGGALSLLYAIDDGLRVEDERRQRLKSGHGDPRDYAPRDL